MIDPDRVAAMAEVGFLPPLIAERLGCSERHVRRIGAERGIEWWENHLLGTDDERLVFWPTLKDAGMSLASIAYCVGRSRQTVFECLGALHLENPEIPDATCELIP